MATVEAGIRDLPRTSPTFSSVRSGAPSQPAAIAGDPPQREIWELADPATIFAAEVVCEEVERCFARHPEISSVVVEHTAPDGRLEILTRRRLTVELAGRLGHGRSLYGHRPVAALPGHGETLILESAMALTDAGARVLTRSQAYRYDDFIVVDPAGNIGTVSVARLFAELARLHAHRAVHDRLTGMPNRELFVERLRELSGPVATLFVDLDDFKAVNDSLGHSAGDELLIVVSERLESVSAESETVARLSGDEFGVLQPGGNEASAREAAARIEAALKTPVWLFGRTITVSASIGIAVSSGNDIAMLLRNADIAMYESKRFGKGRHTVYRDEMFRRASRRLELKADVDNALANGQFRLVYQPIVSLGDGATIAVEALLRWQHPRLGAVPPLDFITLAEESEAIVEIGKWVIETACEQVRTWETETGHAMNVSVNVSSRQLEHRTFPDDVRAALERAGLEPGRLTLEITETAVASDGPASLEVLRQLSALGVSLAVDDFGVGFSSLERLERLPVDLLKIDRSFVARLDGTGDTRLLHGLRSLAEAMGISTIVEGIETSEQLDALTELGYRFGQGFHMSKPLEADAIGARLAAEAPAHTR